MITVRNRQEEEMNTADLYYRQLDITNELKLHITGLAKEIEELVEGKRNQQAQIISLTKELTDWPARFQRVVNALCALVESRS
jgi:predicted phage tail protein